MKPKTAQSKIRVDIFDLVAAIGRVADVMSPAG